MTYTKQPRSIPGIDKTDRENAEPLHFQQIKTGHFAVDEMNDNISSIQCGLSNLYMKLLKLNAVLIQQKQQEEEGNI